MTFPYVAVLLRMCAFISSDNSVLDKLASFLIIPSVSSPTDTAPYKEESVILYSWMNWGLEIGSAIAVKKSVA